MQLFFTALKFIEDTQMLFHCKKAEQNIVLWAYTHDTPHLVHVLEHVLSIEFCLTLALGNHSCQHLDSARFSSSIVAQKHKDLVTEHF